MRRLAPILSALFCAACPLNSPSTGDTACTSSDACVANLTCQQGICGVPEPEPRALRFTFTPPNSATLQAQRTRELELTPGQRQDFVLVQSVSIQGLVTRIGASAPPDGTLIFERTDAPWSLHRQQVRIENGAFETRLLPGT